MQFQLFQPMGGVGARHRRLQSDSAINGETIQAENKIIAVHAKREEVFIFVLP